MSDASVRTARADDLSAVGEVQAAVWRAALADVVDPATLASFEPSNFEAAWRESLAQPPSPLHRLLVATELDDTVGFVAIGPAESSGSGEILAGGVLPERRGRGHGSRLLNAAIDTLAVNDIDHVRVRVPERDTPLVRFLAEAGFALSGNFVDRVINSDGDTLREIELHTGVGDTGPDEQPHDHAH
ncbi:GNAT family N-acetyltransferase [Yimella sp. cx-51]|uniref:GNAT family N-acetyltransferase n=1 Tax=Yimella sp. cx-51 TaxID=2770551 RepID=UPI00165D4A66|nr:GNAT family N-acetyltransferase [Yimella sp. cx-51]MBC9957179.1 GNAT family N-acetyltransferase [Yimella sp. cx-51]QTH37171.1 GNAT family N-acetyltransferase [Yimella sp. cx-51]